MVSLCFVSSEAIRYYDIFVLENGFLKRHISCLADNVSFQISGCILLYSSFILFSKMKSTDHLIIILLWVSHFSL